MGHLCIDPPASCTRFLWCTRAASRRLPISWRRHQDAGSFQTLLTAAEAAGLVDHKSEGPFTVFAPTDEAFAKLPEGTVESLLKPENQEQLKAILTYHVVPGKTMPSERPRRQAGRGRERSKAATPSRIDATGDNVMVGDAHGDPGRRRGRQRRHPRDRRGHPASI